jgi:cysteine desulfurase
MREMKKFSAPKYANPSSWYKEGVAAKKVMEASREIVADFLHAHPDEIVFTSGGTEANNLAILGAFQVVKEAGLLNPHLTISSIEHSSIMEIANMLEKHGCEVTRLRVDRNGSIDLNELNRSIKPNTFMISIMTVNNEIGTVQPIREIAKIIRHTRKQNGGKYPLFHTDAAQAAIYNDLNVEKLGVDLLTLDGSKVYGPRGIGALYVKRGTPIKPIIFGGGQESGMRSGTENLPGIAGFAKALEIAQSDDPTVQLFKVRNLRAMMIEGLRAIRPDIKVNGPAEGESVSPHILNVSIPGIDNEFFVLRLDANGIAVSTKSSCLRDEKESYVLKAMSGNSKESVRFSFGRWTKDRNIKKVLKIIARLVQNIPANL